MRRHPRGSALITALGMTTLLLSFVMALMMYANQERTRAVILSRKMERLSCAEAGMQMARSYFGRNYQASGNWQNWLNNPSVYNPVGNFKNGFNPTPADPTSATLQASYPQLFADLDGDGKNDVYIYMRDNQDEYETMGGYVGDKWYWDSDLSVIVGSICISQTMAPRINGKLDTNRAQVEGILYWTSPTGSPSQSNGGTGSGNFN